MAELEHDEKGGGAGGSAVAGFDYQVDASIWLALDLMVGAKLTSEMILEHVSQEDLEADIEEHAPEMGASSAAMHGYRLIVQAKRRTGNAWTEAAFATLLKHGKKRKSAIQRLEEDPNARYLLITSAALNDPVRKLGVRRAGAWPQSSDTPPGISAIGQNIAGRIAVIGSEDDERLLTDIKTLLIERFRVPNANWNICLQALRAAAWTRVRGEAGGIWTHDQVAQTILEHHGYFAGSSELDAYVKPTNWGDIKQSLGKHHAVMIVGQSGSGKTMTSEALWQELRTEIPGLKRVHITHGPTQLREDTTVPPVLYDVEDPWGRFRFEPDSRPWNDQLASAFQSARHDRLFVATSRLDVAKSSGALESVERWRVSLDAENYGRRERRKLYRNLTATLPAELRPVSHEHEGYVLTQLTLPLEIRKYFDTLPQLDRDELLKEPHAAVRQAIHQAHRDSIERTVVEQIEARESVKAAAVIWALIKPHGRLSADLLRSIDDALADNDPELEESIGQLINSFVAARNLRQGADGSLSYYHGKVEAGMETALAAHPQATRRTLRNLVDVLVARDGQKGGNWGTETAAQIIHSADRLEAARPQVAQRSQEAIDRWLEREIESAGRQLNERLTLAASVGSDRSNLAELARWLMHRPDQTFPGFREWGKPDRNEAWYERLRKDSAVRSVLRSFIETVLPTDRTVFTDDFSRAVIPLAGDMTDAFLAAAEASVGYGYIDNDDVIVAGALADLDRFETVVEQAVSALRSTPEESAEAARNRLMIINEEVSEDYAEHIATDDDGHTAFEYLHAFVVELRRKRGWEAVASHRHIEVLRYHWLRILEKQKPAARSPEELDGVFTAGYDSDDERALWSVLASHWRPRFAEELIVRIADGSPSADIRIAALECLAVNISDRISEVVSRLENAGGKARLAQLACDLVIYATQRRRNQEKRSATAATLIRKLPETYRELWLADLDIQKNRVPKISLRALTELSSILDAPDEVRVARLRLALHIDLGVEKDVQVILADSDDPNHAICAIDAAIHCGLHLEIDKALDHKFAHVAARALSAIAEPMAAPLEEKILKRAKRDSSPVRKALVALLRAKSHPDHLPTLLALVADEWSKDAPREADDGMYPIAREAIEAIADLASLPDDAFQVLIDRAESTEDLWLIRELLSCVAKHGDLKWQSQVLGMSKSGSRLAVGQAAAYALFAQHEDLNDEIVAGITTKMILNLPSSIAGYLVVTVGLRGTTDAIEAIRNSLVGTDDRRIFLALLARATRDRDVSQAKRIAESLPYGHPARSWAEGAEDLVERKQLIDLGDNAAVKEVHRWMSRE